MEQAVKTAAGTPQGTRLTLAEIVDWLVEDKLADPEVAATLKKERRYYRGAMHPLAIIADQTWKQGAKKSDSKL